jgi:hypothetical protein
MENNLTLNFSYKYSKENFVELVNKSISILLDFTPKYMCIYFNEYKSINKVYDKQYLYELLLENPSSIELISEKYNEKNTDNYKIMNIQKHNSYYMDLDITKINSSLIFDSNTISEFLGFNGFVCGYCYNNSYIESNVFFNNIRFKSSEYEYLSFISTYGISFVAAPIIWFGNPMFEILDKKIFLNNFTCEIININNNYIYKLNLYSIDESSKIDFVLEKQNYIWNTLNIKNKFKEFEIKITEAINKDLGITSDMDVMEYLRIKLKKKKKK